MIPPEQVNGWTKNEKLVLETLSRYECHFTDIYRALTDIKIEIATLKVKSGMWGMIGGLIPVIVAIIVYIVKEM